MIWTDKTHFYAATTCKHLGRTCPAAQKMAEKLAAALTAAKPLTAEDFEMDGQSELSGCESSCSARFVASHDRIRLYCGVPATAEREGLELFADAILSRDGQAFAAGQLPHRPCALVEALPKTVAAQQADQALAL